MPHWTQRLPAGRSLLAALAALLLTAACAQDSGFVDELIDNPPSAAALPGDLAVEDTSEAELNRPLHNNRAVRYTLAGGEADDSSMSITVVTFTHRQAAASFMQEQWAAGRMQGVIDDDVEQGELYMPGTPRREDILCVDVSPDGHDGPETVSGRVCATAAERLLVVSEAWSDGDVALPDVPFQVALLDAGVEHAIRLLEDE